MVHAHKTVSLHSSPARQEVTTAALFATVSSTPSLRLFLSAVATLTVILTAAIALFISDFFSALISLCHRFVFIHLTSSDVIYPTVPWPTTPVFLCIVDGGDVTFSVDIDISLNREKTLDHPKEPIKDKRKNAFRWTCFSRPRLSLPRRDNSPRYVSFAFML